MNLGEFWETYIVIENNFEPRDTYLTSLVGKISLAYGSK